MKRFARGLASAGRVGDLALFLLATALLWTVFSAALWVSLSAFHIACPPHIAPFVLGLIAVSSMLPSAPGNVGTFHYFGVVALGLIGVEPSLAIASIVAYHALDMLSALTLGAICTAAAGSPLLAWRAGAPQSISSGSRPEVDVLPAQRDAFAPPARTVRESPQHEVAAENV